MSCVELQPLDGGGTIAVPEEKTTVGRGPFLQVTDKRVSRNHASLEVVDDKLILTPIHTNPCFFRPVGESPQITLEKDQAKTLQHNDVIGLLPDKLFFRVLYKNQRKQKKIKESASLESVENGDATQDNDTSPSKVAVVRKRPMALPLDKKRSLPAWMRGAGKRAPTTSTPSTSTPRSVAENVRTPIKTSRGGGQKRQSESVTPGRRPRAASLKSPRYKDEDYVMSESDSESDVPRKRTRSDEDSDYDGENLHDSDWEQPRKATKAKGRRNSKGRTGGRARRNSRYESDEDSEESEEEIKKKPSRRRQRQEESDSEEDVPRRRPRRASVKKVTDPWEEECEEEVKTVKKDERDMCQYGKKCYRKNPKHFEEFCHPGDTSWESDQEETKPSKKAARPQRKAAKPKGKSVLDGASDDDGEKNTYDYDDSFLATLDDVSESSSYENPDSDSEWDPDDGSAEDIRGLVKEAKGFMRNKKMAKPSRYK